MLVFISYRTLYILVDLIYYDKINQYNECCSKVETQFDLSIISVY